MATLLLIRHLLLRYVDMITSITMVDTGKMMGFGSTKDGFLTLLFRIV